MSAHAKSRKSHCQNCGALLHGPYCSVCGQHDVDYHRSLWPILEESLEGFLHFDGKFFRTVRWLFTRPGFLTKEFNSGKRVSYTQPLRLYLFASFLFFASGLVLRHPPTQAEAAQAKADSAGENEERTQNEGAAADGTVQKSPGAKQSTIARLLENLGRADKKEVTKELRHLVPTMAFFCLPLLATALLIAYPRSGRVYVEHLIFALHVQAFYFLASLITAAIQALVGLVSVSLAGLAGFLCFLAGTWLVYRAFREVYGQGRWRTILKMAFVGATYGIVLIIGITVTSIAAALLVLKS